jgi:hypothetical protein
MIEVIKDIGASVVDNFKTQPLCLALLIMNGALLYFLFVSSAQELQRKHEVQGFIEKLVNTCLSATPTGRQ